MKPPSAALLTSVSTWSQVYSTLAIHQRTRHESDATPSQWPEENLGITEMLQQARRHTIERIGADSAPQWMPKEQVPEKLQSVLALGRDLSFYLGGDVAAFEATRDCENNRFMATTAQVPMGTDEGQLAQLAGVLWDNNEYTLEEYFVSRLLCGDLVRADDPSVADLCFPACGGAAEQAERDRIRQELRKTNGPVKNLGGFDIENLGLVFEVPFHQREKWHDCRNIGLFYEVEERTDDDMQGMWKRCKIMVPYMHGVAQLSEDASMPYDTVFQKPTLLSFVGGTTQGDARGRLLHEMVEYAKQRSSQDEGTTSDDLFVMPFDLPHNQGKFWHTPEMYKLAWEQYAASEFSWQPYGDTATRRGFYDAWMFGSIPVLSYPTSKYYRQLFSRALMPYLKSVAVLLPEEVQVDGPSIVQYVANISDEGRQERRAAMRIIAPMMQWGWKAEGDALIAALGLLQLDSPRDSLQGEYVDKYESLDDQEVKAEVLMKIGDKEHIQEMAFPFGQDSMVFPFWPSPVQETGATSSKTQNFRTRRNRDQGLLAWTTMRKALAREIHIQDQELSARESVLVPHHDSQARFSSP